jgi:hypothetical protein
MPNPKGNAATLKPYQPKWRAGRTQVIRVPAALTGQIFEFARMLDEGINPPSQANQDYLLRSAIDELKHLYETCPRNNFNQERKAQLKDAINKLESLVTVK